MKRGSRSFAAANYVMAGVFALSAAVQYNDPDGLVWVAAYALPAAACVLAAHRRLHWALPVVVGGAALVWAAVIAPRVLGRVGFGELFASMQMKTLAVEQAREMGGLLIVAAWMTVLAVAALRRRVRTSRQT